MLLTQCKSPEFLEVIKLGLNDSYELIRRFSAVYAGKNGSPELIPYIIRSFANNQKGSRVNFQLQNAMPMFSYNALITELESQRPYKHHYDEADMVAKAKAAIANRFSDKKYVKDLAQLTASEPDAREIRAFIRQMRNNPLHPAIDQLVSYLYSCQDEEFRIKLIEAFGWFNYSYRASEVAKHMQAVADDSRFSDKVRNEARKTVARLSF